MMTEKYPTWLTGHVKEWAQKRLPTVKLCSTTGSELLEVWYYGDLLTVKGEPQSYIVDGDEAPGLVAARDPESGEEFIIFDGGRHGYDNMFCDEHDPSELEHRPLKRYEIPASKLVLELGYSVDFEDEKEDFGYRRADQRRAYALGAGQAGRHRLYRPLLCERGRETSPDSGCRAGVSIAIPSFGNLRRCPMNQEEQIRLYRLMEKLNWFFHQEMHYLNRDIAEQTARECYPEIREFTYDILWNDLPKEAQEQLEED